MPERGSERLALRLEGSTKILDSVDALRCCPKVLVGDGLGMRALERSLLSLSSFLFPLSTVLFDQSREPDKPRKAESFSFVAKIMVVVVFPVPPAPLALNPNVWTDPDFESLIV
jgi:hypothetical protein